MSIPQVFGFLCVVLNVILIPLAAYYIYRRLKRRKDVLDVCFDRARDRGEGDKDATQPQPSTAEQQASSVRDLFLNRRTSVNIGRPTTGAATRFSVLL